MKEKLRNKLQKKRRQLSPYSVKEKSWNIVNNIKDSEAFNQSTKIAYYYSVNGEANPAELTQSNPTEQKLFYLPILSKVDNQGLVFAKVSTKTKFKKNIYSIPEPICDKKQLINGEELDLVIVPLLCFDKQGNRLGMGGGFYDRCFAFKKNNISRPVLMGFAYDFQEVDSLIAEIWDVSLDMIATESELIIVS